MFIAAQITVLLAGALIATWADAWKSIGHFFTTLTATGLTGVLGGAHRSITRRGYATVRRGGLSHFQALQPGACSSVQDAAHRGEQCCNGPRRSGNVVKVREYSSG